MTTQNKFDQNISIVYNHFLSVDRKPLLPDVSEKSFNLQQGGFKNLNRKV
jgi:hypothetical protein